ncbi:MAG: TIGR02186 family protein [Hyphomicrobiales bacterium]|nr:TIGR02186 family protein [Hyphomicrobiales bacterium]
MMRRLAAALSIIAALSAPAAAETVTTAVSSPTVSVSSNFTGTDIVVFGDVERDAATVSRGAEGYDVVVIVSGPGEAVVTRRKERIVGIWINRDSRTYVGVPSYYAVLANRPLDKVTTPELLDKLHLGIDNLVIPTGGNPTAEESRADGDFMEAFRRLKQKSGLYLTDATGVEFLSSTLFKASLHLPANVPVGELRADVFLFRDGALLARQTQTINITKIGFEQFTYEAAYNYALIYGIAAVLLAYFTGWLAGVLFKKD